MAKQKSLSKAVRKGLLESGLTQTQIAEASGTSQRMVSDFLRGRDISSHSLDKLLAATNCTWKVPAKVTIRERYR